MKEFVISEAQAETAILVALVTKTQNEQKTAEYLDELEFLAETAGAVTIKRFTQKMDGPSSVTYVGKGKLDEIRAFIEQEEEQEREVGMVIFDDELSAKQLRNIEQALHVKILDRTSLILDIFAMRAQTANAKTQVELAQYRYMLPRLQRLWTHLERQGGGSGSGGGKGSVGLRGPGETQLEMDRRIILGRMSLLKQRLADIDRQKATQRKNRGRLMSDTVGFIRKIPTDLVDSFKSTLDEVREADLLLHVVDISHPDFEEQIDVVNRTLADLGCAETPRLLIFNKIDAYSWEPKEADDLTPPTRRNVSLAELERTWMAKAADGCIFISATRRENIVALRQLLYKRVRQLHVQKYPYNDFLYPMAEDLDSEPDDSAPDLSAYHS